MRIANDGAIDRTCGEVAPPTTAAAETSPFSIGLGYAAKGLRFMLLPNRAVTDGRRELCRGLMMSKLPLRETTCTALPSLSDSLESMYELGGRASASGDRETRRTLRRGFSTLKS